MNIKNKQSKGRKLPITLTIIGLILTAGVIAGFVFQNKLKGAISDIQTNVENQGKPKFIFATAKFPDWATTGNNWVNPKDITDYGGSSRDDLPIADISVQQCKTGSSCSDLVEKCRPWHDDKNTNCKALAQSTMNSPCFVMAFYNDKIIDSEQATTTYINHQKSFGDFMTVKEVGSRTLAMDTPEGNKNYKLHYYDYESKSSDLTKHGNAIGYVSLSSGHVEVRSICTETSQLDETLPILQAVRLAK